MVEAVVEFDYVANEDDELTLNVGDVITNVVKISDGWCEGTLNGKKGMFPDNFVKEVKKEKPADALQASKRKPAGAGVSELRKQIGNVKIAATPPAGVPVKKASKKAKVMHEYESKNNDELTLEVGQVIEILKQEEEGWWEGHLNGRIGMFPSNFVEVIEQEETEKPGDEVHEIRGRRVQGVGFGNIFTGGPINLRPTDRKPVSIPAMANVNNKPAVAAEPVRGPPKAKVATPTTPPSLAPVPVPVQSAPQPPSSVVEAKPQVRAVVRYPYDAVNDDELTLAEGEIIIVLDQNLVDAGWWKGELRGRIGVFPDNFVELQPLEEKPSRPPVPAAVHANGAMSGPKTGLGPVNDSSKAKKEDTKEPLVRQSSIPLVDPPQPPKKVAPKVPEARPTIETDDHKAKKKKVPTATLR